MKRFSHFLFPILTAALFFAGLTIVNEDVCGPNSIETGAVVASFPLPDPEIERSSKKSVHDTVVRLPLAASDRWSDAEVLARKRSPLGDDGTAFRLQRIVKRRGLRYPIFVEEEIELAPGDGSILSRHSLSERAADHILLMPRDRIGRSELREELSGRGLTLGERLSERGPYLVFLEEEDWAIGAVAAQVADLNGSAFADWVAYAEFDFVRRVASVPNDTLYQAGDLWGLHNDGSRPGGVAGVDIGAEEGWKIRADARGVTVAVVDTGIRYSHVDLVANMWVNALEIEGNGIDDDGNGYVDDIHGINALYSSKLSIGGDPYDDNGHGTHVAGTIGAVGNNGDGITGVAWKVELMALKFLGEDGNGMDSDAIKCIDYAIANGADIINNSWGGSGVNKALDDAVSRANEAGVIVVVAAGNGGDDIDVEAFTPAGIDLPNVVTVGNHDSSGRVHPSSNYGNQTVDLMAPGTLIQSTSDSTDTSYRFQSGTSMAASHVSGILALVKAEYPDEDTTRLIERLLQGAVKDNRYGGLVRAGARANLAGALSITKLAPTSPSRATVFGIDGQAVLAWQHEWTGALDGFRVERKANGGSWDTLAQGASDKRSFIDDTLSLLFDYEYRVIAFNENGDSLPSHRVVLNAVVRDDERVVLKLPESDDGIGYGQAIDASDNTLIVGAPKDDDAGAESGSVYLYDRMAGSMWQYRQKLIASDAGPYDFFGYSVSVDGDLMGVGAFGDDEQGIDAGAVYLYERGPLGSWKDVRKLTALGAESHDRFGFSVSVDGNRLAAAARDDDDSGINSGAVFIFERDASGNWNQETKLVLPNESPRAYFGWSLALHGDVLVVGAKGDDQGGVGAGAVYVYRRARGNWSLEQIIVLDDASAYDGFGFGVAFDGNSIVVGAPNRDGDELDSGSVFLYRWDGSRWSLSETFEALEPKRGGRFGSYVAVDGNRVAAVGSSDGDLDTEVRLFEEDALEGWRDERALFGKGLVPVVGSSVALSHGVMSAGNAKSGELQSLYDIPEKLLSLDAEIGPGGVRLSWSKASGGNERVVVERRVAQVGDWEILALVDSDELGFLDTLAYGNRRWEYRVSVVSGGVSTASDSIATPLLPAGQLVNLSARGYIGTGERVLIPGFTVSGSGELEVGVRARGPILLDHGIVNSIADPRLSVLRGGTRIGSNDDWFDDYSAADMRQFEAASGAAPVGLFASESVYIASFEQGVFTALIDNVSGEMGLGLAELFVIPQDGAYEDGASLVNLSARGFVDTGNAVLIGGFSIAGETPMQLLIRGVGPGLADKGIGEVLEDPRITIYDSNGLAIQSNDDWDGEESASQIETLSAQLGAFDLERGSGDAAFLMVLSPGLYTVILESADGGSGVGLLELYAVP